MRAIARFVSGLTARGTAWITLGLAVIAIAALFALLPKSAADGYPPSGLPDSSEAAQVSALLADFPSADPTAGILVWSRDDDLLLTDGDKAAITTNAAALAEDSIAPQAVVPQFSDDGK